MKKVIFELKLGPNLGFYKVKEDIGLALNKLFPDWRTDALHLNFYNVEDQNQAFLEHNRLAYVCENVKEAKTDIEKFKKIFASYSELAKINQVKRLGVRNTIVIPVPFKYQEIVSIFQDRFYKKDKKIDQLLGVKEYTDVVFSIDFEKDGFKYHYLIGPTRKSETIQRADLKFEHEEEEIGDVNLLIDIDCYIENNIKKESIVEMIHEIQTKLDNLIIETNNFLDLKT